MTLLYAMQSSVRVMLYNYSSVLRIGRAAVSGPWGMCNITRVPFNTVSIAQQEANAS